MNHTDLESTYELLANHIDKFDETKASVYLARVTLLMAAEINDINVIRKCITAAAQTLEDLEKAK